MPNEYPHRKTIRHFNQESHAHLLTFTCCHRRPLLENNEWCELLSRSIDKAVLAHQFQLIAFVYMPEHVHLLVYPLRPVCRIEGLLYAIKRPLSGRVKRRMTETSDPLLKKLTIQERPAKLSFRFWQEGPGHDRNLTSVEQCIVVAEYLHNNPVRRGLCKSPNGWKWSSWKHYHSPGFTDDSLPRIIGFPA